MTLQSFFYSSICYHLLSHVFAKTCLYLNHCDKSKKTYISVESLSMNSKISSEVEVYFPKFTSLWDSRNISPFN